MTYGFMEKAVGSVLCTLIKKDITDKNIRKDIKQEYKEIMTRAKDIGQDNTLLSSYILCAFFIAMNRKDGFSAKENIDILENRMRNSKLIKAFMGDSKSYFSDKKMQNRREWSKNSYEKKYENDWVVDFIEKTDEFDFGYDYRECGCCKLCRDENCPELAKYLCTLDYMLVDIMGIHLDRTMTLADGYDKCDFRFSLKK